MASIIKVDQLSEKTQGGGITLSNVTKLSLVPSTTPSSPSQGDIYLDSSDGELKIYNGTVWKNFSLVNS